MSSGGGVGGGGLFPQDLFKKYNKLSFTEVRPNYSVMSYFFPL